MDGSVPGDLGSRALREGGECGGGRAGVRISRLRPLLFRTGRASDGNRPTRPPAAAAGHLPFVANLIEPFAGARAEAVAGRLLARFGSLNGALTSPSDLDDSEEDADVLRKMRAARVLVLEATREEIARRPVSSRDPSLHGYLTNLIGHQPHEVLHAVFLDGGHGYIADECIARGNAGRLLGSTRRLVARAFELGARGVILAHNHPSGIARPSQEDMASTARINDLVAELDLALIDHLIVTRHQVFSFAAEALL